MYQVLARKWRPKSFDELVGQRHVTKALGNAIETERLAHAYIFSGLRGTGKTTVARIFATCLNVEDGPTVTPDPESPIAQEIAEGRSLDVLELDAASRTGVDNIRELQEVISYAPVRDRYKVLIIDEAHMLSKQAFNALLKTLEEPPPNVIFILATTELHKVLPTILSRCQVFEFRPVAFAETTAHLRKIAETEGIEISDSSLERIARVGEGSVRDSLSVLERVLAFCGKQASDDDVLRVLGAVHTDVLVEWVAALAARDADRLLTVLDGVVDDGHDLVHFWGECIGVLRDLMHLRVAPERAERLDRPADEAQSLIEAAGDLSREDLARAFQIVAELEPGLKASSRPRYLFEACMIRLAALGAVRPIEEVLAALGPEAAVAPSPARSRPAAPQKKKPEPVVEAAPAAEPAPKRTLEPREIRRSLLTALGDDHEMLASIVEQSESARIDERKFTLLFPAETKFSARQLEREGARKTIEAVLARIVGRPVALAIAIAEPKARTEGATEVSNDKASLAQQARREPGVKRLLREFGAQVIDVQPLEAAPGPAIPESEEIG